MIDHDPLYWDDDDDDFEGDCEDNSYEEADDDDDDDENPLAPQVYWLDCPNCGESIYDDADYCPHCGDFVTHSTSPFDTWSLGWTIAGGLGIVAVLLAILLGLI